MSQPQVGFHNLIHLILKGQTDEPYSVFKVMFFTVYCLTTLTSCDMDTSNSTVTGSDTFSTGRINWLYLLNNLRKSLSSALDEKQPDRPQKEKKEEELRNMEGKELTVSLHLLC